eukprot:scaffold187681_cov29-Tisochrysis_lutea.AAC.5
MSCRQGSQQCAARLVRAYAFDRVHLLPAKAHCHQTTTALRPAHEHVRGPQGCRRHRLCLCVSHAAKRSEREEVRPRAQ